MTDAELIELLKQKLPEEFTLEEIGLLSSRLKTSAEVRQAFHEQLLMDDQLSAVLGRVDVQVDRILQKRSGNGSGRGISVWSLFGWMATIALLAAAGYFANDLWQMSAAENRDKIARHENELEPPGDLPVEDHGLPAEVEPSPIPRKVDLEPAANSLILAANTFARGDVVSAGENAVDGQGKVGAFAEYDIDLAEAGEYRVQTQYAPGFARPVRLSVNGHEVKPLATGDTASGNKAEPPQWFDEGIFTFQKGNNIVRLDSLSYFPALSKLALTSAKDVLPKVPVVLTLEAEKYNDANVIVDQGSIAGAPGAARTVYAEYQFDAPATARYQLALTYAAEERRAIRVVSNNVLLAMQLTLNSTGGWTADKQANRDIGSLTLKKGRNTLRFESDVIVTRGKDVTYTGMREHPFPHIDKFTLTEIIEEAVTKRPPWEDPEQYLAPPRNWGEIALDGFPRSVQPPTTEETSRWLVPRNWYQENWDRYRMTKLEGVYPVRAPWSEATVLRIAFVNPEKFKLHFWRGLKGITLMNYEWPGKNWVAYRVERDSLDEPRPKRFKELLANDENRYGRTNPVPFQSFDLACADNCLALRRGDVTFLRVPFEGLPEEMYVDGKALLRGMQLVRRSDKLPPVDVRPATWTTDQFAQQEWIKKFPTKGTELKFHGDGTVELTGEKLSEPNWASIPLPKQAFGEVVFEIRGATPGGRVYLGNEKGEPRVSAGLMKDQRTNNPLVSLFHPHDQRREDSSDVENLQSTWAEPPLWIRIVYGGGGAKLWIGSDGVNWVRTRQPLEALTGPISSLGLLLAPGDPPANIRVRQVQVREFARLMTLASAELLAQAPTIVAGWPDDWRKVVREKQPAKAAAEDWEIACLMKGLLTAPPKDQANNMLLRLADLGIPKEPGTTERIALLNELVCLADLYDERVLRMFLAQFDRVGRMAIAARESRPYTNVGVAVLDSPLWTAVAYSAFLDGLARHELFELIYNDRWPEAAEVCRRLRLYSAYPANETSLLEWAEDAVNQKLGRFEFAAKLRPDRQHPWLEELGKEAFNVSAEFDSAIQAEAYKDAGQIVSSALANDKLGLLPATGDKRLFLSLRANVVLAMSEHPELRKAISAQFGPVGQLRLRQAIAAGNANIVDSIAAQFPNTDVAAEALRWLGDRELSAGNLTAAGLRYKAARQAAGPGAVDQIAARQRFTEALEGREFGKPVLVPVELGEIRLDAGQFEALIQRTKDKRVVYSSPAAEDPYSGISRQSPKLSSLHPTVRASWDAKAFPNLKLLPPDWSDWHIEGVAANSAIVFNNRSQLWAWDTRQNRLLWPYSLDGEAGSQAPAQNTPFRPLITEGLVITRLVGRLGPRLLAVESATGKLSWELLRAPGIIVSDPVLVKEDVYVLSAVQKSEEWALQLLKLDRRTGELKTTVPLSRVRAHWVGQRGAGLTLAEGQLVAAAAGVVLSCDLQGNIRWLRKQEWLSPGDDKSSAAQLVQPPLIEGDTVVVQQPGVKAIEALSLETGQLRWRVVLPTVRRIIGRADDMLIVNTLPGLPSTQSAIVGIRLKSGEIAWQQDIDQIQRAALCGGPGGVTVIGIKPGSTATYEFRLMQLDPQTGRITQTLDAPELHLGGRPHAATMLHVNGGIWAWLGNADAQGKPGLFEIK